MQRLLYKTKNGGSPQDKPRVYFICHPDDFVRAFTKGNPTLIRLVDLKHTISFELDTNKE